MFNVIISLSLGLDLALSRALSRDNIRHTMSAEQEPTSSLRASSQDEPPRRQRSGATDSRMEDQSVESILNSVQNLSPLGKKREVNFFGDLMQTISASVIFQPYNVGQTLMQLGYEPVSPSPRYSFIFREYMLYYPGIIGYSRAIIRTDGWSALFRGLGASILHSVVLLAAESVVEPWVTAAVDKLPLSVVGNEGADVPDTEENVSTVRAVFVRGFKYFLVSTCTRTLVRLVAHPFEVISVRTIAQHMTKQDLYSSVTGSMATIYRNEGISGFYTGFIPALFSVVINSAVQTVIWISCESIALHISKFGQIMLKLCLEIPLTIYLPRTYSYPYQLTSRTMMVSGCGLNVSLPQFGSYTDCYNYLSASKALYRGSSVLLPRFVGRIPA